MPNLTGKRVLILGAETEVGRAVTTAVAEAGASVAAVAATAGAEAAFAVQRLARRLSSGERKVIAQAIDATNEAAVRVMVRQVSKELGGLDAVVLSFPLDWNTRAGDFAVVHGVKELSRGGGGVIVEVTSDRTLPPRSLSRGVMMRDVRMTLPLADTINNVLDAIAGESDSG